MVGNDIKLANGADLYEFTILTKFQIVELVYSCVLRYSHAMPARFTMNLLYRFENPLTLGAP